MKYTVSYAFLWESDQQWNIFWLCCYTYIFFLSVEHYYSWNKHEQKQVGSSKVSLEKF